MESLKPPTPTPIPSQAQDNDTVQTSEAFRPAGYSNVAIQIMHLRTFIQNFAETYSPKEQLEPPKHQTMISNIHWGSRSPDKDENQKLRKKLESKRNKVLHLHYQSDTNSV